MDDKTKDMFRNEFGPDTIFDSDEPIHKAAKHFQAFFLARMKKLENCTHEPEKYEFPLDPRVAVKKCYCGKTHYIEMTKAAHDEILKDKDLRNFMNHKIKDGKIIEFTGVEVKIVE